MIGRRVSGADEFAGGIGVDDDEHGILDVFPEPCGLFRHGVMDEVARDTDSILMQGECEWIAERAVVKGNALAIEELDVGGARRTL